MEKKNYIQPNCQLTEWLTGNMMLPGSPTDGSQDPHPAPAKHVPALGNDSVRVF